MTHGNSHGSSGHHLFPINTAATMYIRMPVAPNDDIVNITYKSLMIHAGIPDASAIPPHTPAIHLLVVDLLMMIPPISLRLLYTFRIYHSQ